MLESVVILRENARFGDRLESRNAKPNLDFTIGFFGPEIGRERVAWRPGLQVRH